MGSSLILSILLSLIVYWFKGDYMEKEKKKKYPKGFFMSIGIAMGIPIGLSISIALDNFAFIGVGVAVGTTIGISLESSYHNRGLIRKSSKPIKKHNKQLLYLFFSGTVLFTALLIYYFLVNA